MQTNKRLEQVLSLCFIMTLLSSHLLNVSFCRQHRLQLVQVVQQSVLHFLGVMFPVLLLHLVLQKKERKVIQMTVLLIFKGMHAHCKKLFFKKKKKKKAKFCIQKIQVLSKF